MDTPKLYKVGCAGYIESWERLPDDRFFVQLRGVNRFRVEGEMPQLRGYRRVKAFYGEFHDADVETWRCDRSAILQALTAFGQARGMEVKPDQAVSFTDTELVNLLAISLPLHPAEKQALLEAATLKDRENILVDLLRFGAGSKDPDDEPSPRTLN